MKPEHTNELDQEIETYDQRDLVEAKIRPLLQKVHELCDANNIPFISLVCAAVLPNGDHVINRSVSFNGPKYVPTELAVVNTLIEEGPKQALPIVIGLMTGRPVDIEIHEEGEEGGMIRGLRKRDLH